MNALYLFLILLGSLPMLVTLKRIVRYRAIKNKGTNTMGTVTDIRTSAYKGGSYDSLTVSYVNPSTGQPEVGQAATVFRKYRVGDRIPIAYETDKPDVIIPMDMTGFVPMLGFSILLFVFVIFATYKIREIVESGM